MDTITIGQERMGTYVVECRFTKFGRDTIASLFDVGRMQVILTVSPYLGLTYLFFRLGRGSFGVVTEQRERTTGNLYAVKLLRHEEMRLCDESDPIEREIIMSTQLRNKNIIRLFQVYHEQDQTHLVMELAPAGNLATLIRERGRLDETDARTITQQVARGLRFIHKKGIVHRDVKPANILLLSRAPPQAKVGDLGIARHYSREGMTVIGTTTFMAPEAFTKNYDAKVDCWSLGSVIFNMLAGIRPFKDNELVVNWQTKLYNDRRVEPQFDAAPPGSFSGKAKDLIKRTLQRQPSDRVHMHEICSHIWVKSPTTSPSFAR
ncbi:kinase-like protein [Panus rudis PR-1116 ss-1]|nr:kinase-like protein [Panus rudis PR-1116 ss-1]